MARAATAPPPRCKAGAQCLDVLAANRLVEGFRIKADTELVVGQRSLDHAQLVASWPAAVLSDRLYDISGAPASARGEIGRGGRQRVAPGFR